MLRSYNVTITTNGSGAATSYAGGKITGKVVGIKYTPGTLDTGAGHTITGEDSAAPVFIIASAGTSNVFWTPRILPNKHTDGSAFTDSSSDPPRIFGERIKVVTASGGDTKTGTITFYVEDDSFVPDPSGS